MARLPRKVRVGLHAYRVVDRIDDELRGSTNKERLVVELDGDLPASRLREVALHEVLHACWDATPLRSHKVGAHEETIVEALAPVVLAVLRDNQKLVAFLLDP